MTNDEFIGAGKDIDFEAPKEIESLDRKVAFTKERARQLTQALNEMILKFGAEQSFVDGEADDEYRRGAQAMKRLLPDNLNEFPQEESFFIADNNGRIEFYPTMMSYALATVQNAADYGFCSSKDPDGSNFSSYRLSSLKAGSNFFLTANELQTIDSDSFVTIYDESHEFDRETAQNYYEALLSQEFSKDELANITLVTEYPMASRYRKFYPDLPEDFSRRLEDVILKVEAAIHQASAETQELTSAIFRLGFIFASVGLARLKLIMEKIKQNPDSMPHRDQEWSGENHLVYEMDDYQISEADAKSAQERYLSWLKLNDDPTSTSEALPSAGQ